MKYSRYLLIFSIFLILFMFVSSASAVDNNKTSDVLSIDETHGIENNNDTLKVSSDEVLTAGDNWYVNGSKTSSSNCASAEPPEAGTLEYNIADIIDTEGNPKIIGKNNPDSGYIQSEDKDITVTVRTVAPTLIPTNITVNTTYLDLTVGGTGIIGAALNPPEAGNLTFTSDDTNIAYVDENGVVTALSEGNAIITVSFAGNEQYAPAVNQTIAVTVKKDSNISVLAFDDIEKEIITIFVVLPGNYPSGNVTVILNGKTRIINIADAEKYPMDFHVYMLVNYENLTAGNYTITAIYSGNWQYNPSNATATFVIRKGKNVTMDVDVSPVIEGEPVIFNITITKNATGGVTVDIDGKTVTELVVNGTVIIPFPNLTKGDYIAQIKYSGDTYYNPTSTAVNFTVNPRPEPGKKNLTLSATSEPVTVGENVTIIVTGLENATGNVNARIEGGSLSTPIINGTATFIVPGLTTSTTASIFYAGDDNYNPANTTVNITVNPSPDRKNLTLSATSEPVIAGENVTIIVTGLENATGNVNARIEGGSLSAPIINGTATFIVPGLTTSTTASIFYAGDDNYNPANTTVDITVIPKSDVVIVAENVTKYYGGPERFVATIYDSELNPMVNKSVNIIINNITYTRTTDENGTVSMAIRLGSGTYDVTTQVDNTTAKSTITVLSTVNGKDITKYYRNGTQYSVQVYDTTGKAVGAGEVVSFNINGVFYNRTTDASGIATLNINLPPSNYVITADYKGCKIANNITVLPVLTAEDITMKYMDGTQFVATLVDGQGNPYKEQFVTFNVNGVLYNRLTDSNGVAKLNIRLLPGEYIITSSFNGANIANKITITS